MVDVYARMAQRLEPRYETVEENVVDVKDSVYELEQEARQLKFFSFKGPEKLKKARSIQDEVEELKEKIGGINGQLNEMGEGRSLQQETYDAFSKLNDRASSTNKVILKIEEKLKSVKELISENNLWATLYDIFDEIGRVLSDTAMKVVKISKRVAIKAAEEAKKLPPSSRTRQLAESIGSAFSNVAGFLKGR